MYGLPSDFDSGFFVGRSIESITFSVNTVHVAFDESVSISLQSAFEYRVDSSPTIRQQVPVTESKLMQLVGCVVSRSESQSDGTLTLFFDGQRLLRCLDDTPQYESYRIGNGDKEIYV